MTNLIATKILLLRPNQYLPALFIILLLLSIPAFTQRFDYLPKGKKDIEVEVYKEFAISYSETHEQPYWVAYELTADELRIQRSRKDYFKADANISTKSASLSDYSGSGYDRGHLCRASYCKRSTESYKESFLMSNISPQLPKFNRAGGNWYRLEEMEVSIANKEGMIYSVSGSIFNDNLGYIGDNHVTIPGYFFKVFLSLNNEPKAVAFILRHSNDKATDLWTTAVSVDNLELITNIDFFPALDDIIEERIESIFNKSDWTSSQATNSSRKYY